MREGGHIPLVVLGVNERSESMETQEAKQAQVKERLAEFGASYNPELSFEQNQRRLVILSRMKETGVISFSEEGDLLFDSQNPTKFQQYENQKKTYQTPDVIEALRGLKAYDSGVLQGVGEKQKRPLQKIEIITLPKSVSDAIGEGNSEQGLISIFDLDKAPYRRWADEIRLDSGQKATLFELSFIQHLRALQPRRVNGRLEIYNNHSGQYEPFSIARFLNLSGASRYAINYHGRRLSLKENPRQLFEIAGSNIPTEFCSPADFRTNPLVKRALRRLPKIATPETVSAREEVVTAGLAEFNIPFDHAKSLNENIRRLRILNEMKDNKIIEVHGGQIIFDPARIQNWQAKHKDRFVAKTYKTPEVAQALMGLKGLSKEEFTTAQQSGKPAQLRDIVAIPKSVKDLRLFAEHSQNSIINVWDLDQSHQWHAKIQAQNGEDLTLFELRTVAVLYGDLKAKRDENGVLQIWDEHRKQWRKYSPNLCEDLTGFTCSGVVRGRRIKDGSNMFEFVQKFGRNLLDQDLLKKTDFRTNRTSRTAEVYDFDKRRLNPEQPFIVYKGEGPYSARYYIGRTKVVGTDIPITKDTYSIKLDSGTAGIMESRLGRSRLLCTIKLFDPEAVMQKREESRQNFHRIHPDRTPTTADILGRTIFNKQDVITRVQNYDITQYLPLRDGEKHEDYAKRIERVSNVDFILKAREFFSETGIGIHNLPWSEQMILANAIFEAPDPATLQEFAKKYGTAGLRTFLSMDYDPKLAGAILSLGNKSQYVAQAVFETYNRIINVRDKVRSFLISRYQGDNINDDLIRAIQENIIIRANRILKTANEASSHSSQDMDKLLQKISLEQGNAALLAATIRSIVEAGGSLESIKDLSVSEVTGPQLVPENAQTMEDIYRKNWIHKTTPEYWRLLRDKFIESTKNPKARFRILKDKDKIIAFCRFMKEKDDTGQSYIHFGAFNVDPAYQSGKIGEDFLTPAIELEKQRGLPIHCETNPTNPMLKKYKALGFVEVGRAEEFGEPEVKLEIPVEIKKAA